MAVLKPQERMWFISINIKMLIGFTLVFSIVFAVAFYWFYDFASQQAMNRIQNDMVDTMMGAAKNIKGETLQELYHTAKPRGDGYTDDPRYWDHVNFLAMVSQIEPRANLYTYVKGTEDNQIIYIGSSWSTRTPPEGVKFLEPYVSKGSSWKGLEATTLKLTDDQGNFGYHDAYGYWISGRTPILNAKGEKVGALGIDFRADYVLEVQKSILDKIVLAFLVTYLVLFVLAYLLSRALTGPIKELTRVVELIGEGDYSQDLKKLTKGAIHDEIGKLAMVFTIMVDKVYMREQNLKHQVEELTIHIDETKRMKQVSEIVDSDFFQDIQAKAANIRKHIAETNAAKAEHELHPDSPDVIPFE